MSCSKQQRHLEAFPGQVALNLRRQTHNLTSCHPDLELCVKLVHQIEGCLVPGENFLFFKVNQTQTVLQKTCPRRSLIFFILRLLQNRISTRNDLKKHLGNKNYKGILNIIRVTLNFQIKTLTPKMLRLLLCFSGLCKQLLKINLFPKISTFFYRFQNIKCTKLKSSCECYFRILYCF